MGFEGVADSRPEAGKPKAGSLDRSSKAKSKKLVPVGSESYGNKVGAVKVNWKGQADSRPGSAK